MRLRGVDCEITTSHFLTRVSTRFLEHPIRGAMTKDTTVTTNMLSEAQYINQLIATKVPVNIYISNGVKLSGHIHFYSPADHVIWLRPQAGHGDDLSMVFLNLVSTISPVGPRYLNRRAAREGDGVLSEA
jgi:sRNA-binding regulator protein Hfq